MHEHPLVLRALEAYVRRPLEHTPIDLLVFAPCKAAYLDAVDASRQRAHATARKDD